MDSGIGVMIRRCTDRDFERIYSVINDSAVAYRGVIPEDRLKTPYMSREELRHEIDEGVVFYGFEEEGEIQGVMGIQQVLDVTLIRHAYVCTARRNRGIGGKLLSHLRQMTDKPILIGTWTDASSAVRFYEGRGFKLVSESEKNLLLRRYWNVPDRQIDTSVVLAEDRWREVGIR